MAIVKFCPGWPGWPALAARITSPQRGNAFRLIVIFDIARMVISSEAYRSAAAEIHAARVIWDKFPDSRWRSGTDNVPTWSASFLRLMRSIRWKIGLRRMNISSVFIHNDKMTSHASFPPVNIHLIIQDDLWREKAIAWMRILSLIYRHSYA